MIWLLLIIALVLSFLLSGIESAVLSVSRVRVRHAADAGGKRAPELLRLIEDREALLGAVTVANHVTNLTAFLIITWKLIQTLGPVGYAVGFLFALPVFLIGLEVVPKTLFRRYPYRILVHLYPLVAISGWFRAPFKAIRRMHQGDAPTLPDEGSAREDFKALSVTLSKDGLLSPGAASLIARVIDYRAFKTGDLMVLLTETAAVPPDLTVNDALRLAAQRGFSGLPVMDGKGNLGGILDIISLPGQLPPDRLVRQHMRPAEETFSTTPALETLQRLRKRGRTLAVVKDPQTGRPVGIISEEDLLAPLLRRAAVSVPALDAAPAALRV